MKLKTLNDFLEPLYKTLEELNQKIINLKDKPSDEHTILMMTHSSICGEIRAYQNSKEEAIKWVKDCNCYAGKNKTIVALGYCNACLRTIMMNNITEEDLE